MVNQSGVSVLKMPRSQLINFLMVLFFTTRVLSDGLYTEEKPMWSLLMHTVLAVVLSLMFMLDGKKKEGVSILVFMLFLFSAMMVSSLYSHVPIINHLKFALQIYIPCLFLAASTLSKERVRECSGRFIKYLSIPSFIFISVLLYATYTVENDRGVSLYQFYQNAPNHVAAQTLLKIAIPSITSSVVLAVIPLLVLIIINVRSVILSYIMSLIFSQKANLMSASFLKKGLLIGLPLIAIAAFSVDWAELYGRVVFKGREAGIENASSGRTVIYGYYIRYIIENFTVTEFLFGEGPIWLSDQGPELSAHNDFLNLITSFGVVGTSLVLFLYYNFYKSLEGIGRTIFATTFLVLFITNGVVFHQSNVLFVLLYACGYKYMKPKLSGVMR